VQGASKEGQLRTFNEVELQPILRREDEKVVHRWFISTVRQAQEKKCESHLKGWLQKGQN
jgi:hypothetical protein